MKDDDRDLQALISEAREAWKEWSKVPDEQMGSGFEAALYDRWQALQRRAEDRLHALIRGEATR